MRTRLTLTPGQRGTKKLLSRYGDWLICVRYRYDEEKKKRYKTVELIVEAVDWEPERQPTSPLDQTVYVKVEWGEANIAWKIKNAGGVWNKKRKVWEMPYSQVEALGLTERMISVQD